MGNFKQKQITTKSGQVYTLQHPGVRAVTKITDRIKNKFGVMSDEKMAEEMLAHVVVEPKLKIDDFESYREMLEVVQESFKFVTGTGDDEGNG